VKMEGDKAEIAVSCIGRECKADMHLVRDAWWRVFAV
jgi:hypothetical protein